MAKPRAEVRESLEKGIEEYVSGRLRRHEAYEFNIKIHKINLPRGARRNFEEDVVNDSVQSFMQHSLRDFVEDLKSEFPWIHNVTQEGRSGGWLVIEPEYGLVGKEAGIQTLRLRVKDLQRISKMVREGIKNVITTLESTEFWELKKQDWSPRD